ncbi:MAG: ATP-binding protein [Candidatus Riflebacteria bacterium]|nr:ATP-binding protein [Candidatus Riflebacteria bacterium]
MKVKSAKIQKAPSIHSLLRNYVVVLTTMDEGSIWFRLRCCHCLVKAFDAVFCSQLLETIIRILPQKLLIALWKHLEPFLVFVPDPLHPDRRSPFDQYDTPVDILGWFHLYDLKVRRKIVQHLADLLAGWNSSHPRPARPAKTSLLGRLDEVAALFRLNEVERDILGVIYLKRTNHLFDQLFDHGIDRSGNRRLTDTILTWFLPYPWGKVAQAIREEGTLRRMGMITDDIDLSPEIAAFLSRLTDEPLSAGYFKRCRSAALPFDKTQVAPRDVEVIKALVANRPAGKGVNLLLAGPPGTGKTEFARSLGQALGMDVFEAIILGGKNRDENVNFRFRSIVAFQAMYGGTRAAMLVIDEADALINNGQGFFAALFGDTQGKAVVNQCLDEARNVQVWITNRDEGLDDSTCRRFDYVVRFQKPGVAQRRQFWHTLRERYQLAATLSDQDVERFAAEFPAGVGGIDVALRNVQNLVREGWDRPRILGLIERLLVSHQKVMGIRQGPAADTGGLRPGLASMDQLGLKNPDQFRRLQQALAPLEHRGTGQAPDPAALPRLRILLQGKPGTGKTFFVRHLAERLDRPLVIKTAADLLNPYVGMTERLIREAFEEAEAGESLLFFDEIDGLMRSRALASRSWEVTQVNELLTCMENFPGIFLAATNCGEMLDPASVRRFGFKIEFDYLKPDANPAFYHTLLAALVDGPPPAALAARLATLDGLAPGDFAAVRQRFAPLPWGSFTHDDLLAGLLEERAARHPPTRIGFSI